MKITDFTYKHIEQAKQIAKNNYHEECNFVPILPLVDLLPDLTEFADNELGVVAFEDGEMVGFICCYAPSDNHFGTTGVKGVFSPIHAHGTVKKDRQSIYSRLYQAAAEKWVSRGIISHAIALYTHDRAAVDSFFNNGFGLRCIDAMRTLEEIDSAEGLPCQFSELSKDEISRILPLKNLLIDHLRKSAIFMTYSPVSENELIETIERRKSRLFAAKMNDGIIAYIEIMDSGENFICEDANMMNICGAYCLPEYRGQGVFSNLLAFLIKTLKNEGYMGLGVDFESFNPTARGFWLKHFTQYTSSVVRRIDEFIMKG